MKIMNSALQRSQSNARGQVMVEFALVLPILVLLFMGTMDLARAVYAYGVISNAARDGAHWGSLHPLNDAGQMDLEAIKQKTKEKTTALEKNRVMVAPQCLPNEDNEYEHDIDHACSSWNFLTVGVWYEFHPITLFFTSFTLYSESTMTIE